MTLRTGKLDVLAAELVGPGEEGWEDVLAVFTRALVEEKGRGYPSGMSVLTSLASALYPRVAPGWLAHEPNLGISVWTPEDVAALLPETDVSEWDRIRDALVRLGLSEDTPVVVRVDESVSTGSPAPTHWNLYSNGEYVGSAPVKKPQPPKRCMWVWGDEDGLHQCDRPRSEPHAHTERGAVLFHPRWEGEPRCLGVQLGGRVGEPLELVQCESLRYACHVTHLVYAKTRMTEAKQSSVKSPPWFPRCLWVWHDIEGWHQCAQPRSGHDHDEVPGRYVGFDTSDEPRCLGVWTVERQPREVEVVQCPLLASECESYHPFYARRTFTEQT